MEEFIQWIECIEDTRQQSKIRYTIQEVVLIIFCSELCKRILCRIRKRCRLVVANCLCSDVLEYLIKSLSEVTECNGTVVREVVLDKNVSVESSHLRNSEYTDTTK